jgi:hypothetical protein
MSVTVPMPGPNAEEEQWSRAEQVLPDLARDLGTLRNLSKGLYQNLVRSTDVTHFLHKLAPQLICSIQSIEKQMAIYTGVQRVQEITKKQVADAEERANKFEQMAWDFQDELRATHVLNYFKELHLTTMIEELMKHKESSTTAILEETPAPLEQLSLPFDAKTSDEAVLEETHAPSDQLSLPFVAETSDEAIVEDTLAPSD